MLGLGFGRSRCLVIGCFLCCGAAMLAAATAELLRPLLAPMGRRAPDGASLGFGSRMRTCSASLRSRPSTALWRITFPFAFLDADFIDGEDRLGPGLSHVHAT